MKKLILTITLCSILAGCAVGAVATASNTHANDGAPANVPQEYSLFYVNGMPCIWMEKDSYRSERHAGWAGLSCDWSRWSGE